MRSSAVVVPRTRHHAEPVDSTLFHIVQPILDDLLKRAWMAPNGLLSRSVAEATTGEQLCAMLRSKEWQEAEDEFLKKGLRLKLNWSFKNEGGSLHKDMPNPHDRRKLKLCLLAKREDTPRG